jgi:transcriptional regulator with XRE-family HTH domain
MTRVVESVPPLQALRKSRNLSVEEIASRVSQYLQRTVSPEYIRVIENRGTRVYDYIEAFAKAIDMPIEIVGKAALPRQKSR